MPAQPERASETPVPPGKHLATWVVLGVAAVCVLALFALRCPYGPATARAYPSRTLPPEPPPVLRAAPGPSDDYYPCSDCHADEPVDRTVRQLEDEHDDLELAHGDLWCLDCHNPLERDLLRLSSERTVPFEDAWRLCTQCHGSKLEDWRAGVHGKRTGHWWGPKEYRACGECHSAHSPRFEALAPEPPPRRPEQIRLAVTPEGGAE